MPIPKPTTKSNALKQAKKLGLKSVHKMPGGKYHPGASHSALVRAVKK